MAKTLNETYQVGTGPIRLTVILGNAQLGGSAVSLDGSTLTVGDVDHQMIGLGPAVKGKTLFIKSNVSDVNNATKTTVITYVLEGGSATKSFQLSEDAADIGETVTYRATFILS